MNWIDIPQSDNKYQVNIKGEIRHKKTKRIRKPYLSSCGYYVLSCHFGKKVKILLYHRIIAEAFIPNPENKPEVNHKDLNKLNNDLLNLEWSTHKENMMHAGRSGVLGSKGEFPNICNYCLNQFLGANKNQKFCSKNCWQKNKRNQLKSKLE